MLKDIFITGGVAAALIAAFVSIRLSASDHKAIKKLEELKHEFDKELEELRHEFDKELEELRHEHSFNDGIRQQMIDAYNELNQILPFDKQIGFKISNINSLDAEEKKAKLFDLSSSFEDNMDIVYSNFKKYRYLFSKDDQLSIDDKFAELNLYTQNANSLLIAIHSEGESSSEELSNSYVAAKRKCVLQASKVETALFDLYKKCLSR